MKKRLRKKHNIGEFKGMEIDLECRFIECADKTKCDDFFEELVSKIEGLGLSCSGKSIQGKLKFSIYGEENKKLSNADLEELKKFLENDNQLQDYKFSDMHQELF